MIDAIKDEIYPDDPRPNRNIDPEDFCQWKTRNFIRNYGKSSSIDGGRFAIQQANTQHSLVDINYAELERRSIEVSTNGR